MKDSAFFVITILMVCVFCFTVIGYSAGHANGTREACTSIGLEWVKDKCMKVTREAV